MTPASPLPNPHAVAAWLDINRTTDRLLRSGLRRKVGPDGDVDAAHREWYERHMDDHDLVLANMLRRMKTGSTEVEHAG